MSRRTRVFAALVGTAVVALAVSVASASASYHLMKIRAVFLGPPGDSFVELQMTADGQNFVNGQKIDIYNATATGLHPTYILNHDVASGQNQRTILIADTAQPTTPDFLTAGLYTDLNTFKTAGALCYSSIDCVSWGSFTGDANLPTPAGTPIAGGLSTTQVISRSIAGGCATALDNADDTNNSSADFSFGVGFPLRSNATAPTETLCPTPAGTAPPPASKKKKCKKPKKSATSAKKKKCKKRK
jgi:hypothetical protein